MKMRWPSPFNFLFSLSITVVFILATGLVARLGEKFTVREMAVGLLLTVVFLTVAWALIVFTHRDYQEAEVGTILRQLRSIASLLHFPWLCDDDALAKREAEVTGDVWIISPDLVNVTEKTQISEVVKRNIARGINYTYIMPNSEKISWALPHLEKLAKKHSNRLQKIVLDQEEFRRLSVTHIAIFNAGPTSDTSSLEVFLELPIAEPDGKKIRGHWVQVQRDAAKDLAGRFSEIIRQRNRESSI